MQVLFIGIVMELNFSLKAKHPMVAFWGAISDEHLSNVFRFEDRDFLNRVKIVLGDEYMWGGIQIPY